MKGDLDQRSNYESKRVNSYRRKVMKDINYQVKEYLSSNLAFLIERLERFYKDLEEKQRKSTNQNLMKK